MTTYFQIRKPVTNRTFGIEIECYPIRTVAKDEYHGFWFATYDGSLCWHGVEFVSQPLTPEWLKKEINKLYGRAPWGYRDDCGIHVHVSRGALSTKKANKIYSFLTSMEEEDRIKLFGRGENTYSSYHAAPDIKYRAVNLLHKDTVEFRMFRGGNAKWACYCVDMVKYLVDNANHLHIDGIMAFHSIAQQG